MAGEELSAGPAARNYEPLYFCGDASLSNQAVGMERHIGFIFSFILSKHSPSHGGEHKRITMCLCLVYRQQRSEALQCPKNTRNCIPATPSENCMIFFFPFSKRKYVPKRGPKAHKVSMLYNVCVRTAGQKSNAITCARANRCACRETESPSSPRCHSSLPDRPFKSHSGG